MNKRIGIFGFGRIGRNIFRILNEQDEYSVGAICDLAEAKAMEYLLRFDTVHGRFPDSISTKENKFYIRGKEIDYVQGKEPGSVNWQELGIDVVIDATAKYRKRSSLEKHLQAGAKKVILASPPENFSDVDAMVIRGINDDTLKAEHGLISTSSITANALALMLKVLNEAFGVERAFMSTIHAYTNDQRLADVPHSDLRRSRAAAENIIPTDTYAPLVVGQVIPELEGKVLGMAMNVPVPDGSNVDLVCQLKKATSVDSVNEVLRSAAGSTRYRGLMEYMEEPIVSSDVIGDTHSAIVDSLATQMIGDKMLKTITWYDNGWGYAKRVTEVMEEIFAMEGAK